MKIIRLAFLWAATASLTGVILWSVLAGVTWSVNNPDVTLARTLVAIPFAIAVSAYWAAFIGAAALPIYTALFAVWLLILRRRTAWQTSPTIRWLEAFALSLPPTILLTRGFAVSLVGFDRHQALLIFPIALLSCFLAVWLPRRLVPSLRDALTVPAF